MDEAPASVRAGTKAVTRCNVAGRLPLVNQSLPSSGTPTLASGITYHWLLLCREPTFNVLNFPADECCSDSRWVHDPQRLISLSGQSRPANAQCISELVRSLKMGIGRRPCRLMVLVFIPKIGAGYFYAPKVCRQFRTRPFWRT